MTMKQDLKKVDSLIDVLYVLELWEQGEITDEQLQEIVYDG